MHDYQDPRPHQDVPSGAHQAPIAPAKLSGMAVAGLATGIVALVLSPVPIVNNFSFVLALVGVIFSIVGVVAASRGVRRGRGLAIAGLLICVVSFVVVLVSQNMYGAALDDALSGPGAVGSTGGQPAGESVASSSQAGDGGSSQDSASPDFSSLPVGSTVDLDNGLSVRVDSVQAGLTNYDGSAVTGVSVTYVNNGDSAASFNVFDWKGEDAQGAQRSTGYYSEGTNALDSGSLAAGGTVSGNVYFDGDLAKVIYTSSIFDKGSDIAWVVS